jgi:hypothetical protein
VHWASGIPHALSLGGNFLHNPGASRRGIAELYLEHQSHEQAFAHYAPKPRFGLPHRIFPIIAVRDIKS